MFNANYYRFFLNTSLFILDAGHITLTIKLSGFCD